MAYTATKLAAYAALVMDRKTCGACHGLENPALCCGGRYDSDHIGPWSRWQANLDAKVMVIGQEWGGVARFVRNQGRTQSTNPTNAAIIELLRSIGIAIGTPEAEDGHAGAVFFTNTALCLKQGSLQAAVEAEWFRNCGERFLKPLVELVQPEAIVCLGERAYRALEWLYDLPHTPFRMAVEAAEGLTIPGGPRVYGVYHCGRRIQNTHRPFDQQKRDWGRIHWQA